LITRATSLDDKAMNDKALCQWPPAVQAQVQVQAWRYRASLRTIEFAPIISGGNNENPAWQQWTDGAVQEQRIKRQAAVFAQGPGQGRPAGLPDREEALADERLRILDVVRHDELATTEPRPRNHALADAMKCIGVVERSGRGVDTIYRDMLRYGRPEPTTGASMRRTWCCDWPLWTRTNHSCGWWWRKKAGAAARCRSTA
jgi:hypothetical protein